MRHWDLVQYEALECGDPLREYKAIGPSCLTQGNIGPLSHKHEVLRLNSGGCTAPLLMYEVLDPGSGEM